MNAKFLAVLLSLLALSARIHAAPAKPKTPTNPGAKTTASAKPMPPKGVLPSGVNITPITRNESVSKIAFPLAKDGKALAPIVISEKAGPYTKLVAAELQKYLSQMSGAKFEVETGNGESGIVLGTRGEFPTGRLRFIGPQPNSVVTPHS